jgi:glucokinase
METGRELPLLAAIDVGGTKTIVEVFDAGLRTAERTVEFSTPRDGDVVAPLVEAVEKLTDGQSVSAIAVGCPGPLDHDDGVVLVPPNLSRSWWHLPLGRALAERLMCAVTLENDANLGALGEAVSGAGRGYSSVLYLTVSTGVGAGFVAGDTIFRGGRGFGLEVGHTTIAASVKARCACGRYGCLEALASGSAIANRAGELGFRGEGFEVTARSVAAAAELGDRIAIQVLEAAAIYLAQGIVNFLYLLDPSLVLVGGGVAQSDLFIDLVKRGVASEKVMDPFRHVPVRRAQLGGSSVITGARVLAMRA